MKKGTRRKTMLIGVASLVVVALIFVTNPLTIDKPIREDDIPGSSTTTTSPYTSTTTGGMVDNPDTVPTDEPMGSAILTLTVSSEWVGLKATITVDAEIITQYTAALTEISCEFIDIKTEVRLPTGKSAIEVFSHTFSYYGTYYCRVTVKAYHVASSTTYNHQKTEEFSISASKPTYSVVYSGSEQLVDDGQYFSSAPGYLSVAALALVPLFRKFRTSRRHREEKL